MAPTINPNVKVVHDGQGRAIEVIIPIATYRVILDRLGDAFDLDLIEASRLEEGPDLPLEDLLRGSSPPGG